MMDDGIVDVSGCVPVGQVEQQRVPGGTLDKCSDCGLSFGSDDQVAFPAFGECPVFHDGGALTDHHHGLLQTRPRLTTVRGWAPAGAALAHEGSDLFAECACGLDEDGLVDRFHARVHALIMRETHA